MPQKSDRRCDCCDVLATFVQYHKANLFELDLGQKKIGDAGAAAVGEFIRAPLVMSCCRAHGMEEEVMYASASSSAVSFCDLLECRVNVVLRSVSH